MKVYANNTTIDGRNYWSVQPWNQKYKQPEIIWYWMSDLIEKLNLVEIYESILKRPNNYFCL